MAAAVHSNVGQRATAVERKVVYKSALDNPFKIPWPHVPLNVQNAALATLITILAGVADYHIARQTASRKRKRAQHNRERKERAQTRKKRKLEAANKTTDAEGSNMETINAPEADSVDIDATEAEAVAASTDNVGHTEMDLDEGAETSLPPQPSIFSHLTFGINSVTRRLEAQSKALRPHISVSHQETVASSPADPPPLTHVFVCRTDIDPPLLIAHLPELVAACNTPSPATPLTPIYLVPLPKHAEHSLSEVVGLRRVSVLAFDATTPSVSALTSLLSAVRPPSAPWLTTTPATHVPTHIKQLRTTAPRDIRAAKHERSERRQAAKEQKREKENGTKEKGTSSKTESSAKSAGKARKEKKKKVTAPVT